MSAEHPQIVSIDEGGGIEWSDGGYTNADGEHFPPDDPPPPPRPPEGIKINLIEKWNVYKWDAGIVGETPPDPTQIDASQHPGCIEIWEMTEGEPARCIHRRN